MCGITAIAAQCQLARLGFLSVEDVQQEEERAQDGAPVFEDQVVTMRWTQNNDVLFDVATAHVIVFGHSAGGWAVCHLTCDTKHGCMLSGLVMQSSLYGDTRSVECERYSDILVWVLQHACKGSGLHLPHCFQSVDVSNISHHDGDVEIGCAFGHEEHH